MRRGGKQSSTQLWRFEAVLFVRCSQGRADRIADDLANFCIKQDGIEFHCSSAQPCDPETGEPLARRKRSKKR